MPEMQRSQHPTLTTFSLPRGTPMPDTEPSPAPKPSATERVRQIEPWLVVGSTLATALIALLVAIGFGLKRPTERVEAVEQAVDSLVRRVTAEEQATQEIATALRTLIDAKCVELTPQQASYVDINCTRVYNRIRNAEAIQRGRTGGPPP